MVRSGKGPDRVDVPADDDRWGLVGVLIGIIGGPMGMLIGRPSKAFVGSPFDIHDIEENKSALGAISNSARVGHPVLWAVVIEQSPEVLYTVMTKLGGTVLRRSVSDVEAEVAPIEKAERKASGRRARNWCVPAALTTTKRLTRRSRSPRQS
jgi:hypothetical protein